MMYTLHIYKYKYLIGFTCYFWNFYQVIWLYNLQVIHFFMLAWAQKVICKKWKTKGAGKGELNLVYEWPPNISLMQLNNFFLTFGKKFWLSHWDEDFPESGLAFCAGTSWLLSAIWSNGMLRSLLISLSLNL